MSITNAKPGERVTLEFVVVGTTEGGNVTLETTEPERVGYPLRFSTLPPPAQEAIGQ